MTEVGKGEGKGGRKRKVSEAGPREIHHQQAYHTRRRVQHTHAATWDGDGARRTTLAR